MNDYTDFLRQKIKLASFKGFDVPMEEINPALAPHTREIARWAVQGGNRAIFASFGLHKTATQLEIMRLIGQHRSGIRGIVMPLGVRQEFKAEIVKRFTGDCAVDLRFIRSDSEIDDERTIYMTNYESVRDGKIDVSKWLASSLDEASVLRSCGSKTYQEFLPAFDDVEFKFVATATPSPNRYKELIHYAGYLGVMDTGQALTRFFQRDSEKAGNLTLYPHKEQEFWLWVASWAVFIQRPSDLGHSDDGYVLPPLHVRYHEVPSDYSAAGADKRGQGLLIPDVAMGLSAAAAEKRQSMAARVAKTADIIAEAPQDHFIVWHDLEDERHAIQQAVPEAVSVWGTQDLDEREQSIVDFGNGQYRILSTKPVIAGSGCNFQRHCHREIFAGVGFKFNDFSMANVYDYEWHVKIGEELLARGALPSTFMSLAPGSHHPDVWHDINRMRTLNGDQTNRAVEKHVCPLQFDIVDRLIERYSVKGERVYDPFCGLGTVPVRAIQLGRTGGGSELSASYFKDQVHYLRAAEREFSMPTLFDFEAPEEELRLAA